MKHKNKSKERGIICGLSHSLVIDRRHCQDSCLLSDSGALITWKLMLSSGQNKHERY